MGDDEVGVGHVPVDREDRQHHARDPADREEGEEADREVQRRLELDRAPPQRGDPVEDLHAGGDRDDHRGQHEERQHHGRERRDEHVVRPHQQRQEGDADRRGRDRPVAEDRLAREHGKDLADDPEPGQDHDVDLGVPEEPEQVLPE